MDYAGREGHLDSSAMQVYVNGKLMEKVGAPEACIYSLDFDINVECTDNFEFKICGTGTSNSYGMTIGNAELSYVQVPGIINGGGLTWGINGWNNRPIINVQPIVVNPVHPVPQQPLPNIPQTPININPVIVKPTNPIYVRPEQPIQNPINIEQVYVKPINGVSVKPQVPHLDPINIEHIYTKPVTGVTVNPYIPNPTPINIEQAYVYEISPVKVVPIKPVGPVINFPTGPVTIKCDNGKYLSRCTKCGSGAYSDSASISETNPYNSDARWTVVKIGDYYALKGDNGKYLSKCKQCWDQNTNQQVPYDSAFVHVPDASTTSISLWVVVPLNNGKWAFQSADTGKFLSRCTNCVKTGLFPDFAFVQADDCNNSAAQWEVQPC